MGYYTKYALAVRAEVVNEFWHKVKASDLLKNTFKYATISRDDNGHICLSGLVNRWIDIEGELGRVLNDLEEMHDNAYVIVTIGDAWDDHTYDGTFSDHEFGIYAIRRLKVRHKKKIEFPTGITIMKEAIEDGGVERDDK